jgi:predicted dehydrogenase
MIRLALVEAADASMHASALPLRGTILASDAHADACDAIAFLRDAPLATIEHWLQQGKHILLTAPSLGPADAEALWAAARQVGVQFAFVNPERYRPTRRLLREQVAGKLGAAGLVRIHRWEPAGAPSTTSLGLPGPLVGDIDLALWLTRRTPNLVYAVEQPATAYVQVHLGFPGGGMALLDYAGGLPAGGDYQSLSVIAAAGAAYADDHQNMQLVYRGGQPQAVRTSEVAAQRAAMLQDFVDGLATGRDLSATVSEWRSVYAVAEAVRQALAAQRAIPLEGR